LAGFNATYYDIVTFGSGLLFGPPCRSIQH